MELTIEQVLQQGIAAHKEGKLQDAERLYRAILQSQPSHPDANHNLGLLAVSVNKAEAALPLFKNALEANPRIEQFWLSYIDALIKEKQFDNAKEILEQGKKEGVDAGKLNSLKAQIVPIPQTENANSASPSQKQLDSLLEDYQNGRFNEAEKLAVSLTQEFPKHQFGWKVLGAVLGQTDRKSEAVDANQKAVQLFPQDAVAHSNLGVTLKALGRLDEAEASYTQAIALKPDYAEAHSNLGNMLRELSRFEEAEASLRQAIALKPGYTEAHSNLGITLQELGRLAEAEASLRQAIALKPDYAEVHSNLGNTLIELSRLEEAEASLRQAIALKPGYAEAHNSLGVALQELGRLDEAEASYTQAIALKPDYSDAYLNLCELLERRNKLDEVLLVIKNAKGKVVDKESDFLFFQALASFRHEAYEIAETSVKKIKEDDLTEKRKLSYLKLKADWYHHEKDFSVAFETFKVMNEIVKDSSEYKKQRASEYINEKREIVFQLRRLQGKSSYKPAVQATRLQPTFLVGFPRSGTTLLDTILRSHSKIDVVEEQPMLGKMKESLGYLPNITTIEEIDNAAAEIASSFYFEELKKHIELGKNPIVIDKLPLNILHLPLINQIFPDARFILALRHPLDCVLSCWMQNFELNPPMANMVDLDGIVDFYCTAMEILSLSQKRYSLNIHRIRYEDLVLDFEGEVLNVLAFLNLKWEEDLRNYQKTAISRDRIRTPSYSQIVKPIYNTATYRWKNYEKYLDSFKQRLEPWLSDYGYLD